MTMNTNRIFAIAGLGLLVGASLSTLQGCDDGGIPGCDLSCPAEGVLEGNASISGVAEVDAFFGAVVDVGAAANGIAGSLRAELDAIAVSVGLEPGATGAEISTAIDAHLALYIDVDAGLQIKAQAPRCEASVDVAVAAAAECDAEVDPGSATVECSGGCEVDASATASCEGDATLTCTGTAPNFACSGSCEGTCELEAAATCEGTCRGTCTGTCSVMDSQGNCAGGCDGMCQGTCELNAGGSCSGSCTGSCTYDAPMGGCEASATAKCEASADASVQCDGRCEGEVEPPSVSAECEATVEAKADASIECFPPSIDVTWQWNAEAAANADVQAEFKAWLQGFKGHIGVMLAAKTKADILIESVDNLGVAAEGALQASFEGLAEGDFVASFKVVTCAIPQLGDAADLLASASGSLSAEASASGEVVTSLGM